MFNEDLKGPNMPIKLLNKPKPLVKPTVRDSTSSKELLRLSTYKTSDASQCAPSIIYRNLALIGTKANAPVNDLVARQEQPLQVARAATINKIQQIAARRQIDLDQPGFMRLDEVLAVYPVSRASWYAGIANGIYPKSVALGPRSVGWRTSDIKALIENPPTAKATAANKPHKRGGPDT